MNILLIDDHPLFGVGFVHALSHAGDGLHVQSALTIEQGLAVAAATPNLDIVLIDYRLSLADGIDGLRRFGAQFPLVARVLISGDEDPGLIARARAAGASAFLGKSLAIDHVLAVLQRVAQGDVVFDARAIERYAQTQWPTARQMEVLALLAQGHQNKRIAADLGISERTVKLHVTALLDLLSARNRTHLLVVAGEKGLL
jgi:DNA-binding NarL/FixJ family response regulator